MSEKVNPLQQPDMERKVIKLIEQMTFTKNFRSATSEEWYVFLTDYSDPHTGGAVGTVIIHYELQGNRDVYIHTTMIFKDPSLYEPEMYPLLYAISDELINRLVGYANTLLTVHAGENSYDAEYIR